MSVQSTLKDIQVDYIHDITGTYDQFDETITIICVTCKNKLPICNAHTVTVGFKGIVQSSFFTFCSENCLGMFSLRTGVIVT